MTDKIVIRATDDELGDIPGLVIVPDKPTKAERKQLKRADAEMAEAIANQTTLEK